MTTLIKITAPDRFLLSKTLLGTTKAQLWIGPHPDGPLDNNDERVLWDRIKAEQEQKSPGKHRVSGIETVTLEESTEFLGWYMVDTSNWIPGAYRFNLHGIAYEQAPHGTPLLPIRDGQYSWPSISDEDLMALSDEQKQFLYLERNNAGYCFRVEVHEDRTISPAGDGLEWVHRWSEIKQKVESHKQEKIDLAKKTP